MKLATLATEEFEFLAKNSWKKSEISFVDGYDSSSEGLVTVTVPFMPIMS